MTALKRYFEKKLDHYPGKNRLLMELMSWAEDKDSFYGAIESRIMKKSSASGLEPHEFVDQLFSMDVDGWLSKFN